MARLVMPRECPYRKPQNGTIAAAKDTIQAEALRSSMSRMVAGLGGADEEAGIATDNERSFPSSLLELWYFSHYNAGCSYVVLLFTMFNTPSTFYVVH